jgi:hypothetical protein
MIFLLSKSGLDLQLLTLELGKKRVDDTGDI